MNKRFAILLLPFLSTFFLTAQTQIGADIDGEAAYNNSGWATSLSTDGNRVAIGAPNNNANGSNSGHVRIYEDSGGIWTQVGADIVGEALGDGSGESVSLDSQGTRVAIGATGNNGNGSGSGHVRIYEESGGTWTQIGADIDGEAPDDGSGESVSMNSQGTRVAIGATYNDGNGTSSGHVRIYEESGGMWTQIGTDIDGEASGDRSGFSVCLNSQGTRLAVGALFNNGNGTLSGHVRIYEESGGVWTQVGVDINGEALGDGSGRSVSLNSQGTRVAIGATHNDGNGSNSGHVRIYKESGGTWTQVGTDIDGEAAQDNSGRSVSLDSQGTRVAIGASSNDGNGSYSGHVRIYEENGGTWTQIDADINGENSGDQAGRSVTLSADGNRVVTGAPYNDGNGSNSGHVRVFDMTAQLPVELIHFRAYPIKKNVQLSWQTASETNNKGFDLQKSTDGVQWEHLTFINGLGTTALTQSYKFVDNKVSSGINYYRLKQIDFDGQFEYSQILAIQIDKDKTKFSFYPNPTTNRIALSLSKANQVTIYNSLGRVLDRFDLGRGQHDLSLKKYGQQLLLLRVGEEWMKVIME